MRAQCRTRSSRGGCTRSFLAHWLLTTGGLEPEAELGQAQGARAPRADGAGARGVLAILVISELRVVSFSLSRLAENAKYENGVVILNRMDINGKF